MEDQNLEEIEKELKEKAHKKKPQKISGRSVFKLKKIIQKKGELNKEDESESTVDDKKG